MLDYFLFLNGTKESEKKRQSAQTDKKGEFRKKGIREREREIERERERERSLQK
jgi:hypothetical protein